MSSPTKGKFRATILYTFHPEIHPEDADLAIRAWIVRTSKSRKKPTPESILEDAFLASLANMPGDKWDDNQMQTVLERLKNKGFMERLARAMSEGKARIWDAIDVFWLKNLRVIRDPMLTEKGVPGLRDWSPRAVCEYLRHLGFDGVGDEGWYVKRRSRLGQKGKNRYRVRGYWCLPEGGARIDFDPIRVDK